MSPSVSLCSQVSPMSLCPKLSPSIPSYFQVSPSVHVSCAPRCLCAFCVPQSPEMSLHVFKSPGVPPCPSMCFPVTVLALSLHAPCVPSCPQGVPPCPCGVPSRCWQRAPLYPGGQRQEPWTQEPPCRQGQEGWQPSASSSSSSLQRGPGDSRTWSLGVTGECAWHAWAQPPTGMPGTGVCSEQV